MKFKSNNLLYVISFFVISFPFAALPETQLIDRPSRSLLFLMVFMSIVLLIVTLIILKKSSEEVELVNLNGNWSYIVLSLFLLISLSAFTSNYKPISFYGYQDRYEGLSTYISYIALFVIALLLKINLNKLERLLKILVFSSLPVCLLGILQHFGIEFFIVDYPKMYGQRSEAYFGNPNFFGSYLVIVLLLSFYFYIKNNNWNKSFLYGCLIITQFVSLAFSSTRSAWLGYSAGVVLIGILLFRSQRHSFKKFAIIVSILGTIFLSINFFENGKTINRAVSIVNDTGMLFSEENSHAGSSRWYIWKNSIPLIKDHFWLGSGPDTFAFVFPNKPDEKEEYFHNRYITIDKAHNEYLQIAVTLGVPALVAYLLLLASILTKGVRVLTVTKNKDEQLLLGTALSAIIGYLVQAFFNISVISVAPYFWLLLGLTLNLTLLISKKHKASKTEISSRKIA